MSIVKSFSVGDGDMFYIKHGTSNFTIIDCCLVEENKYSIVEELKRESKEKGIIRFISTHPDEDHILGLGYLNKKMNLLNFYCVDNKATKPDKTDDFSEYCALRDDAKKHFYLYKECSRRWMNKEGKDESGIDYGSSGINILWPITSNKHYCGELEKAKNGESYNNLSPVVKYSLKDSATILWMGDLETDFMELIKEEIEMDPVDILFAPHHGRDTGNLPEKWLSEMNPKIIIIGEAPSEDLNYYEGYNTITQNSAGDITLECVTSKVHIYVSNEEYSVDFLDDENMGSFPNYIGTLNL